MTSSSVEQKVESGGLAIPMSEWRWHGTPGHLIVAQRCCFRLHTTVGRYRVSTVGCYHPPDSPDEPEPLGAGSMSLYETMVFRLDASGEVDDWGCIDMDRYATEAAAEAGHLALCRKYAAPDPEAVSD